MIQNASAAEPGILAEILGCSAVIAMNRYFFDVYNSDGHVLDKEGQLFESRDRARAEAVRILHDIARDEMPDRDLVKITVKIRSDNGAQMLEVRACQCLPITTITNEVESGQYFFGTFSKAENSCGQH
ncbi:hypothetical protein [Mesorhizobium sp. M00.F.Ca.ET.216.01.1.1]|uniref:DUF6894 family protein n=1 Tax=Mesorhizobium sp. M00.F.Ca.ET.216.01.1.1 TaxID=2500528 RepID=UPI001FDF116C|nr:hypothetical protein [Mesorhizobium sp. M00.F.Ca.ET.216.01.1.1]